MRSALPIEECDLAYALAIIGGKWKIYILWKLQNQRLRFGELRRAVPGISEAVLMTQLKELERDGLLRRIDFNTMPPHVEYELTPIAKSLDEAMMAMHHWAGNHRRLSADD